MRQKGAPITSQTSVVPKFRRNELKHQELLVRDLTGNYDETGVFTTRETHTTSSKFIYLSKKRVMSSFIFKDVEYQAVSIPTALKANNFDWGSIKNITPNFAIVALT